MFSLQRRLRLIVSYVNHRQCQQVYKSYTINAMPKTAGIIIIGDEILKGQTQDTNSNYICQILHNCGVKVKRISVIGDEVDVISSEIEKFSSLYNYVLTSGGIGPTHDDMTYDGAAKAFQVNLEFNETLVEICKNYFGDKPNDSPEMKLALVPATSEIHRFGVNIKDGSQLALKIPLVSIRNVYLFPGVPALLRKLMDALSTQLFSTDDKYHTETLLVNAFETEIAGALTACDEKFHEDGVTIGSYPDWYNNYYKTKLIIESMNESATASALQFLTNGLPANSIINSYQPHSLEESFNLVFDDEVFKKKFPAFHGRLQSSIRTIGEAIQRYPADELCIGFNGGKDCTALLHLYCSIIHKFCPERKHTLKAVYIKDEHSFDEVDQFMTDSVERYNLKMITLTGRMKAALWKLKEEHPTVKAVIMGTRRTDPYSSNYKEFSPTDKDWPPLMRVNPILDWSYHEVWSFLRALHLPYCVLYDRGYTSLGNMNNTTRNEQLSYTDDRGTKRYRPAYMLLTEELERNGRL